MSRKYHHNYKDIHLFFISNLSHIDYKINVHIKHILSGYLLIQNILHILDPDLMN